MASRVPVQILLFVCYLALACLLGPRCGQATRGALPTTDSTAEGSRQLSASGSSGTIGKSAASAQTSRCPHSNQCVALLFPARPPRRPHAGVHVCMLAFAGDTSLPDRVAFLAVFGTDPRCSEIASRMLLLPLPETPRLLPPLALFGSEAYGCTSRSIPPASPTQSLGGIF